MQNHRYLYFSEEDELDDYEVPGKAEPICQGR